MSIIDKISRKSVQDSRLFQEEKLRIPSEFTRFERSLPLKIKMCIISKKLRRAFSIFDFFIYPECACIIQLGLFDGLMIPSLISPMIA